MLAMHTILHPTDFSEHSHYALSLAGALARDHGARLILLHVLPPGTTAVLGLAQIGMHDTKSSVEEDFRQELERLHAPDPAVAVEHRLESGDAAQEILRVAEQEHVDLIVMGTHGRTGLGRLMMGSVAEQVVRRARCAVLVSKDPFPSSATEPRPAGVAVAPA